MITIGIKEIFDLCTYSDNGLNSELNNIIESSIDDLLKLVCNKTYICSIYQNENYILSSVEKKQFEKHQRHLQNVKEQYRKYVRRSGLALFISDPIKESITNGSVLTPEQLEFNNKYFQNLLVNLKTIHKDGIINLKIDLNQD